MWVFIFEFLWHESCFGQTASAVGPMVSGFLQAVSTKLNQTKRRESTCAIGRVFTKASTVVAASRGGNVIWVVLFLARG